MLACLAKVCPSAHKHGDDADREMLFGRPRRLCVTSDRRQCGALLLGIVFVGLTTHLRQGIDPFDSSQSGFNQSSISLQSVVRQMAHDAAEEGVGTVGGMTLDDELLKMEMNARSLRLARQVIDLYTCVYIYIYMYIYICIYSLS